MKKLISLPLLVFLAFACTKDRTSTIEVEPKPAEKKKCAASGNYAKTVDESAKRIVGTWKLTVAANGWAIDSMPEEQRLVFKADGTCTVIKKNLTYAPVKYSIGLLDLEAPSPITGVSGTMPMLTVNDSPRGSRDYFPVGKSILIICQDEMILDYGIGKYADANVLTYKRESDAQ